MIHLIDLALGTVMLLGALPIHPTTYAHADTAWVLWDVHQRADGRIGTDRETLNAYDTKSECMTAARTQAVKVHAGWEQLDRRMGQTSTISPVKEFAQPGFGFLSTGSDGLQTVLHAWQCWPSGTTPR
jgi:hypothetical protein